MSQNEKEVNGGESRKGTKHRSPNYPSMTINDALTRLRQIYQQDRRAFTTFDAVISHMGYKAGSKKSGTSGRAVSALKQYGLLDEIEGKYRVSEAGFKILHLPEDSTERLELIRQAALSPQIFKKLLTHYRGEIPSNAAVKSHLVLNERFNPDSVDSFIRVFRETLSVANPTPEDYNDDEGAEFSEDQREKILRQPVPTGGHGRVQLPTPSSIPPPPVQLMPLALGESELKFNISRESQARVIFNGQVTQEAIEKLAALLNLSKDTFPTKAELEQPRQAIWHNKDHDQPVRVLEDAGVHAGRKYVKIEDSHTAVPEDELSFSDETG